MIEILMVRKGNPWEPVGNDEKIDLVLIYQRLD